ncbi:hypothetical protein CVU75_01745 [Candidatus Dependentiae bacterium HGW-Dependentiae-1]|nr:MAG: hypothetical protein CVU75_01745 [Candidatus Dependentiae bacterium HGW-Dependentiae-1]
MHTAVNQKKCGFILIFTLLFISLSVGMVTYLFVKGQVYAPFMRAMIDREKARSIALSGVQIALSQLTYFPATAQKKESATKTDMRMTPIKRLLERVMPTLNRWQQFTLTSDVDGVDAKLRICVAAECGKININQMYDFKKHAFKGEGNPKEDMKKVMQELCELTQKAMGQTDLFASLESFLKKRSYKLNDVTELLTEKSFAVFKRSLFYEPPVATDAKEKKRPLYLTDLFTTWSQTTALDPLLLSDSVCGLFDFKRAQAGDEEGRKNSLQGALKNVSLQNPTAEQMKKFITQLYGKDFTTLPKSIHSILRLAGEPLVFCVLSSATVNEVTQRVYAIIVCASAKENEGIISFEGKIKRIYWL